MWLTRESDETVPLYVRADAGQRRRRDCFISLHANADAPPAARGAACYYFQRSHYYSEHGRRLAAHLGRTPRGGGLPCLGAFGRNYGVLREARGIAVLVEPLFLSDPERGAAGHRPATWRPSRVRSWPAWRTIWRGPAAGGDDVTTPAEPEGVRLTATQLQRLRELGAGRALAARLRRAAERDAAFRTAEDGLVRAGRRHLKDLSEGVRRRACSSSRPRCAPRSPAPGSCPCLTPLIIAAESLAKMGIEHGHPLRDQVFWLEDGRCLRPMLAPNLYTMLRRLGRMWSRAVRDLRDRPVLPPRQQGREPSQRVHHAQPRRAGHGRADACRERMTSSPRSSWARPA